MPIFIRPWGHLHYKDEGPKDAPAILFANSLGTDLRMWDGVTSLLPLRTIRFDKRGHGLSATPARDWTVEDAAADAIALLDHLNIQTAAIAGCSVGGMIAPAIGIHPPTRATALILSNTAAKIGTAESWAARITAIETGGIASIADTILQRWFPHAFLNSAEHLAWRTMLLRSDPLGYIQTCRALSLADLRAGLAQVTIPTLMLAGSEDQSTPPALVRDTAALIRNAQVLELQGSGHIPAIDAPKVTAQAIQAFLGGLHA